MQENSSDSVPDGLILAERSGEWIHVRIGRARYVKRFNLSDAEARQLFALLAALTGEKQAVLLYGGGEAPPRAPLTVKVKPLRQEVQPRDFQTAR